jgi:hypothetical protein
MKKKGRRKIGLRTPVKAGGPGKRKRFAEVPGILDATVQTGQVFEPGAGTSAVLVHPQDLAARRPLATMFYNYKTKALEFDRVQGVDLQEFIDIVRLYLKPDYGN